MKSYSIVIPTHNRQALIPKNIEYFSSFKNCLIYIVDSTCCPSKGKFPQNFRYLHRPQDSFVEKMNFVLSHVTSQQVAVCADDDYIIEEATKIIVNKIEAGEYVFGVGRYAGFDKPYSGLYRIYENFNELSDKQNAMDRVNSYLQNYYMALWAVYRTDVLKKSYSILEKSNFTNQNLIEIVISIVCAAEGNLFFHSSLYGVREINKPSAKNWAKQQKSIYSEHLEQTLGRQTDSIRQQFGKYFNEALFDKGMNSYLRKSTKNSLLAKILMKIKRIFSRLKHVETKKVDGEEYFSNLLVPIIKKYE